MKITSIKYQVKNPERVSLFVDGKYGFSLSVSELLAEKLKNGVELNQPELDRLKKLSTDGKIKGRALEWLLSRPRSSREFRDYLRRKKVEPEQVDFWLAEYTDKKYLSDDVFATWLIEMRRRGRKSERAIRSELLSKGIPREVIESQLAENNDEDTRLRELIAKKQNLSRYKADPKKLMNYLASQGFGYDDIKLALAKKDE